VLPLNSASDTTSVPVPVAPRLPLTVKWYVPSAMTAPAGSRLPISNAVAVHRFRTLLVISFSRYRMVVVRLGTWACGTRPPWRGHGLRRNVTRGMPRCRNRMRSAVRDTAQRCTAA